jgi:UDP-N-acetylglucosamine acyltransferase
MIQAGTTFSKDVPPYIICSNGANYGGVNYTMGRFYGVDEKVLKHIANAYRLVFNGKASVFDAVMQIEEQVPDSPEIRHIIEFIRATEIGIIAKD